MATSTTDRTHRNWPLYWFAVLDHAVTGGDHVKAAEAQRELDRLGVRVRYGRPGRSGAQAAPEEGVARA